MEIKECGFYRMRNGEIAEVEFISKKYNAPYRAVGGIFEDNDIAFWDLEGSYFKGKPHDRDLIEFIGKTLPKRKVTKKIEGWVNVCGEEIGNTLWLSQGLAINACSKPLKDNIIVVKVTGTYEVEE